MDGAMLAVMLKDLRSQSEQIGRLRGDFRSEVEKLRSTLDGERKATALRLRHIEKDMREIRKKVETPILRQLWGEWWFRFLGILILGLANIDLKEAVAVVLQIK